MKSVEMKAPSLVNQPRSSKSSVGTSQAIKIDRNDFVLSACASAAGKLLNDGVDARGIEMQVIDAVRFDDVS